MRNIFLLYKKPLNRQLKRYENNVNIGSGNFLDGCSIEIRKPIKTLLFGDWR